MLYKEWHVTLPCSFRLTYIKSKSKAQDMTLYLHRLMAYIPYTIVLLIFTLFIYSYPDFGAPTAPRAFELLTRFKRSQFGSDLRQWSCFRNFFLFSLSFSVTLFIQCILPLTWMGRCWLAKTNHMTIQLRYFTDVTPDSKLIRIVRQCNEMIKLMICVGLDARM